jgi:hypothetical protein
MAAELGVHRQTFILEGAEVTGRPGGAATT